MVKFRIMLGQRMIIIFPTLRSYSKGIVWWMFHMCNDIITVAMMKIYVIKHVFNISVRSLCVSVL